MACQIELAQECHEPCRTPQWDSHIDWIVSSWGVEVDRARGGQAICWAISDISG